MRLEKYPVIRALNIALILITLIGAATFVCACSVAQAAPKNITVVDSADREIEISCPVDRIVLLSADNCELAIVLGAEDEIVGVEDGAADYVEIGDKFEKAANVGKYSEPDLEKIAELKPDVVFGYKSSIANGVADKLKSMGIPFVVCECNKIQTFDKDVELMGRVLGKEDKAKEFLVFHNSIMNLLTERTKNISADQRIPLYLTGGGKRPYSTYGKDIDPYCSIVGARNIASGLPEDQLTVSAEWILTQNPSVIIEWIGSTKIKPNDEPLIEVKETYSQDPVLNKTAAVKDGGVHIMGWRVFKGLRFSIGLLYWAKWCHPDLFQDIDPEEYHREYLKKFLNVELKNVWGL
jgi:iron complex transport system substrate-binding protein